MKRIFMTVAAAVLLANGAMAQVKIGPKVGMNLYKMNTSEEMDEEVKEPFTVGFNVGVATSFGITDNVSIAPELIFSQKGSSQKVEEGDDYYKFRIRSNFIEMPVLARVAFGDAVKGYVNAGPSVGYWLGGNLKRDVEINGEAESEDMKYKFITESDFDPNADYEQLPEDSYNRLELGAAIGGGVMLDTSVGDLLLDIRYQVGLSNMVTNEGDEDDKWKNNGLSVSFVYLFGL